MIYYVLASAVTFAAFTVALGSAALGLRLVLPRLLATVARRSSRRRASTLYLLRIVPPVAAAVFAVLLVLPTFVYFEPRHTDERLTLTLGVAALIGLAVVTAATMRGFRAWIATAALAREWERRARPVDGIPAGMPVRAIEDAFPTVAVVGCLRPVLYISERVLTECTPGQIAAMVAHEQAHVVSHDNLKRLLLRCCPSLPFGSTIEQAWSAATEELADAHAGASGPGRRLDLAQALVSIARLAPYATLPAGISAFYVGGTIESRVRRLLTPGAPEAPARAATTVFAIIAALALVATYVALAPEIHEGMEAIVHYLP